MSIYILKQLLMQLFDAIFSSNFLSEIWCQTTCHSETRISTEDGDVQQQGSSMRPVDDSTLATSPTSALLIRIFTPDWLSNAQSDVDLSSTNDPKSGIYEQSIKRLLKCDVCGPWGYISQQVSLL